MKKSSVLCYCVIGIFIIGYLYITIPQSLFSTVSPQGKYSVQTSQNRVFPFIDCEEVFLSLSNDGKSLVENKLLYDGDFFDDDFKDRYPRYSWANDFVLKIGQSNSKKNDSLWISNESPFHIKYLLIETYDDKFIVSDVKPYQNLNLNFEYIGKLSVTGEFDDSSERFSNAVKLTNATTDSFSDVTDKKFIIKITEKSTKIESSNQDLIPDSCCAVDRGSE